jgi:hypothetical protein
MRLLPILLALLAAAGCGGGGEIPDGYATYRGNGVSFVHPAGWEATTKSLGHGITEVRFEDPETSGPAVSLTVQPDVGERFDTQLEGERTVLESAGGAEVTFEEVDVAGAEKAVRSTIESSGAKSEALDVLAPDGRHLALAAGGPKGEQGPLDTGAVVDSFRIEE